MGYCNKRKHTKRRRTRFLNAMKSNANTQQSQASSDDSWLETFEQSSSYASFCSTYSHHSFMSSDDPIPNNIFLDDVNTSTLYQKNHDGSNNGTNTHGNEDEEFSLDDTEYVDELWNGPDIPTDVILLNEVDDDTIQSISSSSVAPCHDSAYGHYQAHDFDRVTRDESASFKIMTLLDSSGAPRICYDQLVALLKKLAKTDGFDIRRHSIMKP